MIMIANAILCLKLDCYACTCWYVTLLINKTELDNAPDGPKVDYFVCLSFIRPNSLLTLSHVPFIGCSSIHGKFGSRLFSWYICWVGQWCKKSCPFYRKRPGIFFRKNSFSFMSFSIHVNHYKLLHVSLRLFSLNVDFSCICILNFNMNIVLAFPEASKIK